MYDRIFNFLNKYFTKAQLFKVMFNFSPMYRRSCGKILFVSEDLFLVKIKIPLSYRNRNYVGSVFGGSLMSATDPIYMIQLMQILGNEFVVWDKETKIRFKRPVYKNVFAIFEFDNKEIQSILDKVKNEKEIDIIKQLQIVDENQLVYTEIEKKIYISTKENYKLKRAKKNKEK